MDAQASRYPLAWPTGWKRTGSVLRRRAQFGKVVSVIAAGGTYGGKKPLTVNDAIARLARELRLLGADREVLSTNLQPRLDGGLRLDRGEPVDPGAAVYFRLHGQPRCLACDRWDRLADNVAALAHHVEALRAIERYGVGTTDQAFAGYAALESSPDEWWLVFELDRAAATLVDVEEAFRRLAKTAHPDAGGSHDRMTRLTAARTAARRALGAPA